MDSAITLEELAQKADERRGQISQQGADGTGRIRQFERGVTVNCEQCRAEFSYLGMFVDGERDTDDPGVITGGREIARRRVCETCVLARRFSDEQIAARQASYTSRLTLQDKDEQLNALLESIGANPWEHGAASFDRFDISERGPKAIASAQEFAAAVKDASRYDPVRGLYLHGETGTDKTDLTVAVVKWLIENDYSPSKIIFDNAAELIARIQDTYGRKEAATMDVLEERFNAGLWILDDLGTERPSDDVARHMTLIFTRRAMRPTLITSNYSPKLLQDQRPEFFRILSRLGPKYFKVVELTGRDRRFD